MLLLSVCMQISFNCMGPYQMPTKSSMLCINNAVACLQPSTCSAVPAFLGDKHVAKLKISTGSLTLDVSIYLTDFNHVWFYVTVVIFTSVTLFLHCTVTFKNGYWSRDSKNYWVNDLIGRNCFGSVISLKTRWPPVERIIIVCQLYE